jgi:glutathione synthase/RimK-type ligase-like ATP-grasp enzyme
LYTALCNAGIETSILAWDDSTVSWSRFDIALLRSPWDYAERLQEFLQWAEVVSKKTRLLNPLPVIQKNTDKHYLGELQQRGIAIVPSQFVEPGENATQALTNFFKRFADAKEFVVKPSVGAGSRDAQRYGREEDRAAITHIERLLKGNRSVLLQPYLDAVDEAGETALIYFNGVYSHAIRKGPLLQRASGPTHELFAAETITPREPSKEERVLADRVVSELPKLFKLTHALPYARIDLLRDQQGQPCLLELELTEPSLFFNYNDQAAARFAQVLTQLSAKSEAA